MDKVLLSIIIPVYNAEKYISRAIESILSQEFENFEIIAVNDGSKDKSLQILESLSQKDKRIKIINKENEGVSRARNFGIQQAKGTYITFMDADDYMEPNGYQGVISELEKTNAQVGIFAFFSEDEKKRETVLLPWDTGTVLKKKEIWEQLIPYMIKVYPEDGLASNIFGSVWRICIRRKFLTEQRASFDPSLHIAEDFDFCIRLYSKAEDIVIINEPLYHYIRWDNTALAVYRKNQFTEGRENQIRLKRFLEEQGQYKNLEKRYVGSYLDVCIGSMVNYVRPGAPSYRIKIKELREVVEQISKDCIYDKRNLVPLTRNQKIVLWLIKKKRVRLILLFTYIRQQRRKG